MFSGCLCWTCIQWLECGWGWPSQGIPIVCITSNYWIFNECNNKKSLGHASWKVICSDCDGSWPTFCSICVRGLPCLWKGYLRKLHLDCNMSWTYGVSIYWNPWQRKLWVEHLFLGICQSCCCTCAFHGVLRREPPLALQGGSDGPTSDCSKFFCISTCSTESICWGHASVWNLPLNIDG